MKRMVKKTFVFLSCAFGFSTLSLILLMEKLGRAGGHFGQPYSMGGPIDRCPSDRCIDDQLVGFLTRHLEPWKNFRDDRCQQGVEELTKPGLKT